MSLHICTNDSMRAGIDIPDSKCPFCQHITCHASWVGSFCSTCGADWSYTRGYCARNIREHAKLSRREMGEAAGLSPKTIKKYEWCEPSKVYFKWLYRFAKDRYTPTRA